MMISRDMPTTTMQTAMTVAVSVSELAVWVASVDTMPVGGGGEIETERRAEKRREERKVEGHKEERV